MIDIAIDRFLSMSRHYTIFDVRSPGEFAQGHIPGAVNLPIVSDEERVVVGTLYKQRSEQDAYLKGLEIVGPKMAEFAQRAIEKARDKKILIYCWRGGQRSGSMAWLFDLVGLKSYRLEGGYKAYRHYIAETFSKPLPLVLIGGYTGTAKTEILLQMQKQGAQVIDLEGLASHKGSVFGAIGMNDQPSYENFEIALYNAIQTFDLSIPIYIEDESRFVGKLQIPSSFFDQMKEAPRITIDKSRTARVKHLSSSYLSVSNDVLVEKVEAISKRLGSERSTIAIEAIQKGDFSTAIEQVLHYYDRAYQNTMDQNSHEIGRIIEDDDQIIIDAIMKIEVFA